MLGIPPSYLVKIYPDMSTADILFMRNFGLAKMSRQQRLVSDLFKK